MKKFFMAIVCLMTMVVFSSCGSDYKSTNMATELSPIFKEYSNWASNDLVVEQFKEKMISFFDSATDKNFSTFYNGKVRFDEIIQAENRNVNATDSVVVRFKCSDHVSLENTKGGYDIFTVKFDVIGKIHKSEASKLNGDIDYHLDGDIFGFLADVELDKYPIPTVDMGHILCKNLIVIQN